MRALLHMGLILGLYLATFTIEAQPQKHQFETKKMGTTFKVVFYYYSAQSPERLEARLIERIDELNQIFSDYDPNSEISKLSKAAGNGEKITVSHDLWVVLLASQRFSKDCYGAFDVSIGPLSKLWRRAIRQKELPSAQAIEAAQELVNFRQIKTYKSKTRVQLTKAGMRLDFGGIAKGYTVDALALILQANGIRSFMIDAGGDIRVGKPPPEQKAWNIKISDSDQVLQLANSAIASSGDTYRFLEWDGIRYSHIVDPRTGYGVQDRPTVYVIAEKGMTADALASAASILTEKSMAEILNVYQARMWIPPSKHKTP